jgi:Inositol monophosphatase family
MWNKTAISTTPCFSIRRKKITTVMSLLSLAAVLFFVALHVIVTKIDAFRFVSINTVNANNHRHQLPCRGKIKTGMIQQELLGSSSSTSSGIVHISSSHDWTLFVRTQAGRLRSDEKDDDDDEFFPVVVNKNGRIILHPDDVQDAMLDAILDVAILASRRAAAIIAEHSAQGTVDVLKTKSNNRRDLLTLIDPLCERTIQETIHTYFPHHAFLGEEGVVGVAECGGTAADAANAALEEKLTLGGWLWIVDPIDGKSILCKASIPPSSFVFCVITNTRAPTRKNQSCSSTLVWRFC